MIGALGLSVSTSREKEGENETEKNEMLLYRIRFFIVLGTRGIEPSLVLRSSKPHSRGWCWNNARI